MSLIGSTNEEKIWNYLKAKGLPDCGIAGLMGNLYAESCLIPTNLQNSYEKDLSFTDAAYTAAVDNGTYQNFVKDSAGVRIRRSRPSQQSIPTSISSTQITLLVMSAV